MPSELLFSRVGPHAWAARREAGRTVELRYETGQAGAGAGDVFLGRVRRVLPGMQAAFVDIGLALDAFLLAADAPPGIAPEAVREGRPLVVQVSREASGTKGPRVTGRVTLPGRYLVLAPLGTERAVSRRVPDGEARVVLERIVAGLEPAAVGFVARTAAAGVSEAALRRDARSLTREWDRVVTLAATGSVPRLLRPADDLLVALLRESPPEGYERIVVDDAEDRDRVLAYLVPIDPGSAARVRLHDGEEPLWTAHGVDQDLDRALRPKVWLPSGGHVVFQQTEALVAVDVNSGKLVTTRAPEETALRTNLEAAAEIARQMRLRDLGGIVVIDFIDMERSGSREQVQAAMTAALRADRARFRIIGFSGAGLFHLTRQRVRRGLEPSVTRPCPACGGHGRLRGVDVVACEAVIETRRLVAHLGASAVTLRTHPDAADATRALIASFGSRGRAVVRVEADPTLAPDRFRVVAATTHLEAT